MYELYDEDLLFQQLIWQGLINYEIIFPILDQKLFLKILKLCLFHKLIHWQSSSA